MPAELKLQILMAGLLALMLLVLFMVIIRTVAGLGYALNRVEEILSREVQLSVKVKEQVKIAFDKSVKERDASNRNELLLNIPFMEKLQKDKKPGDGS